jgi:hypothetical protein
MEIQHDTARCLEVKMKAIGNPGSGANRLVHKFIALVASSLPLSMF